MKRTNILFAIADDASHMSAYGHNFLSTPAFDGEAKVGINGFSISNYLPSWGLAFPGGSKI